MIGSCGLHSIDHYHQRAVGAYRKAGFVEEGACGTTRGTTALATTSS